MRAQYAEAKAIRSLFDVIKGVVSEANLQCSAERGLHMQGMDASHVSLCCVELKPSGMASWDCSQPTVLGLSIETMDKLLKTVEPTDALVLAVEDGDTAVLRIEGRSETRSVAYSMALMDIDVEEVGVPDSLGSNGAIVRLKSQTLQRAVRDVAVVGDACVLEIGTELTLTVEGDVGKGTIVLSEVELVQSPSEPIALTFAVRYLQLFTKAATLVDTVTLTMATDAPLRLDFEALWGRVTFYLAPKLSE